MRRFVRQIRDGNHKEIADVLRREGVEVIETFRPLDLLIYAADGRSGWVEVKTESRKAPIQRTQIEFMAATRMPVAFVKSEDEARQFARTFEGITAKQKRDLAMFLKDATTKAKHFMPQVVERILKWD